jgi:hypothetical protein
MRRLLVLGCVTALLGVLVAVTPAIVRPDANRAEAFVQCEDPVDYPQIVARHGPWAAWVDLCVEVLETDIRPGAEVTCGTASTLVLCNWDFSPMHLHNQRHEVIRSERAYATGKTNGAYIATPHWSSRSQCTSAYSDSPQLRVRFPDGYLTPWVSATWQGIAALYPSC